jgi:hypothetical protein
MTALLWPGRESGYIAQIRGFSAGIVQKCPRHADRTFFIRSMAGSTSGASARTITT